MAAHEPEIHELRARIEASRSQLCDGIKQLESQLNVTRRIRGQLAEHPLILVAVSVAAGLVTARMGPHLLRGAAKPLLQGFLPLAMRAATMFVLPMLTRSNISADVKTK